MKSNDFDSIAKWYDRLASLVFGDAIKTAQAHYLDRLPHEGRLLIMGGGAGWILNEVVSIRPNLKVDYVEASAKMIALAKTTCKSKLNVQFIYGTEIDIPENNYDALITNFFLDVFDPMRLSLVMKKLKSSLTKNGVWLCTDFRKTNKWHQKFLLRVMHVFFRLVSNLDAKTLIDFDKSFTKIGLHCIGKQLFHQGIIFSGVYRANEQ